MFNNLPLKLCFLLTMLMLSMSVNGATFVVSNTSDDIANNGSLRWAFDQADNSPGADDIIISASGAVTLGSEIVFSGDVTVNGSPNFIIYQDGGNALRCNNASNVTLVGLNIEDNVLNFNNVTGMDMNNVSSLTIIACTFTNLRIGIDVNAGDDVSINGNTFIGCGNNGAGFLGVNIQENTTTGTSLDFFSNTFSGGFDAIELNSIENMTISSSGTSGMVLTPTDGRKSVIGRNLSISNMDDIVIDGIELGFDDVDGNARGIALIASNCNNLIVQNIVCDKRVEGLNITGSDTLLVHNNVFTRSSFVGNQPTSEAIRVNGGSNATITNNSMSDFGVNSNRFALHIDGVVADTNGDRLDVQGNTFNSCVDAVILANMSNLKVHETYQISETEVHLPDGDGRKSCTGINLNFNGCDNLIVTHFDLGFDDVDGNARGRALIVSNSSDVLIANNVSDKRLEGVQTTNVDTLIINDNVFTRSSFVGNQPTSEAIRVNGGSNATIINNSITDFGINNNRFALHIDAVVADANGDRIDVQGNTFTTCRNAVNLNDLPGVIIDETLVPGVTEVHLPDSDGRLTCSGINLQLNNSRDVTIEDFDFSFVGTGNVSGLAINVFNCDNLLVQNNTLNDRAEGFRFSQCDTLTVLSNTITSTGTGNTTRAIEVDFGSNATITNNSFSRYGINNNAYTLDINDVTEDTNGDRLNVTGNTFTNCRHGVQIINMDDLKVHSTAMSDTEVLLPNNDGRTECTATNLSIIACDNIVIDDFDLSYSGALTFQGIGLLIQSSVNALVTNVTVDNRGRGIDARNNTDISIMSNTLSNINGRAINAEGGSNYSIKNNSLSNTGTVNDSNASINLLNLIDNGSGRMDITGNTFNGGGYAYFIIGIPDLIVNKNYVSGTTELHVSQSDGRGTLALGDLYFNSCNNLILDDLDIIRSGTNVIQWGIRVVNSISVTVNNVRIDKYNTALRFTNITDLTITNNTLKNGVNGIYQDGTLNGAVIQDNILDSFTGNATNQRTLRFQSVGVSPNTSIQMDASNNKFRDCLGGFQIWNTDDLVVSDGSAPNTNFTVVETDSMWATFSPIDFQNSNNILIDNVTIKPYPGNTSPTGNGILFFNCTNSTVSNSSISGKSTGINIARGDIMNVSNCLLQENTNGLHTQGFNNTNIQNVTAANNNIVCNTSSGVWANTNSIVNAANNFWGSSDGSSTDTGSGDSYLQATNSGNEGFVNNTTTFLTNEDSTSPIGGQAVLNAATILTNGQTATSTSDGTDFETVNTGSSLVRQFRIANGGLDTMHIVGVTSTEAQFAVNNVPAYVLCGDTLAFDVTFSPTTAGNVSSTIAIENDNCYNTEFTFDVAGVGFSVCDIAITSVTPTDEVCPDADDGEIDVIATCTSCTSIEYSIDDFTTMNTTGDFTGLADGTYTVKVRDSGDNTCAAEMMNVVVGAGSDSAGPTISCNDITVDLDAVGTYTLTTADLEALAMGSTDDCSDFSGLMITSTPSTFDCDDVAGQANNLALAFDESTVVNGADYAQSVSNVGITGNADRTLEFWVRMNETNVFNEHMVNWGSVQQGRAFGFYQTNGAELEFYTHDSPGGWDYGTGFIFDQEEWYHVAASYDGSTNTVSVFVNGTPAPNATYTLPGALNTTDAPMILASRPDLAGATYSTIDLDEVRVWDYARTQAEIMADMNVSLNGNETGLVMYYDMELDGTGTTNLVDKVGSNNATLINMDPANDWIASGSPVFSGGTPVVLEVTDAAGNTSTSTCAITVTVNTNLTVSTSSTSESCMDNDDGQITASVTGGTGPYTFTATRQGDGSTVTLTGTSPQTFMNLVADDYIIVVEDNGGCSGTTTENVASSATLCCDISITSVTPTDEACPDAGDGTLTVAATCTACTSIEYSIDGFTTFNTDGIFTGLADGSYDVEVRDSGDATCNDNSTGNVINAGVDNENPFFEDQTTVILYSNDFETPSQTVNANQCGFLIDQTHINTLYSQPGFVFSQTFTVETTDITKPNGYEDPLGIGGDHSITLLSDVNNDILGLQFDRQGLDFLNFRMDIAALGLTACFVNNPTTPEFTVRVYDDPSETFTAATAGSFTLLDEVVVTGVAPDPGNPKFNLQWANVLGDLDVSSATNNKVALVWDITAGGFATFDNIEISASNSGITSVIPADIVVQCLSDVPAPPSNVLAFDNCDANPTVTFMQDPASPVDGDQTIFRIWTAMDASGNTKVDTQTIIINDVTAPDAICQDITINLVDQNPYNLSQADINMIGANSTDNCGGTLTYSITGGQTAYDCDDIGNSFSVTLTADDGNGNTNTCSAMVTIADPNNVCCDISITSVTPTDEVCPDADDGTLTVVATCTTCTSIEYSIDGFTTFNTDGIFTGLADGSYDVEVRDSGDGNCNDSSTGNVINAGVDNEAPMFGQKDFLYSNDFENPASAIDINADAFCFLDAFLDINAINTFYGPGWQQVFTVEPLLINGPNMSFTDPTGIGGDYAIGMLLNDQEDRLSYTFDIGTRDFLNIEMDISPIDLQYSCSNDNTVPGEFGVDTVEFTLTLYDTPGGSFNISNAGSYTVLDQKVLKGDGPGPTSQTFNWKNVETGMDGSLSTDGNVTLYWDVSRSGYCAFDNLVITASDVAAENLIPDDLLINCIDDLPAVPTIDVFDNCDPNPTITYIQTPATPTSGDQVITRSWYVTDATGNQSSTETQTITVDDVFAPVAVCPANPVTLYLNASGNATLTANNLGDGSSTDDCGTVTETNAAVMFDCTTLGAQMVDLIADDGNGNMDAVSCTVMVIDTIAPTAVCQDVTVYLDGNGNVSITAADIDNGSSDNCGISSLILDVTSFDCSTTGANTVTLTASDGTNMSTCTSTVTVLDSIAPVAMCVSVDTVYLDTNGMATLNGADFDNGSTDNCGSNLTYSLSQTSFDCDDVNIQNGCGDFALDFDGVNDYVESTNPIQHGVNLTYEAWVFVESTTTSNFQGIITTFTDQEDYSLAQLAVNSAGQLVGEIKGDNNETVDARIIRSTIEVIEGGWHHLAMTYDGTDMKLYVDGTENATNPPCGANCQFYDNDPLGPYNVNRPILLGAERRKATNFFSDNIIDEARVWGRTLTEAEIASNMVSCLSGNENGLLLYYQLEENGQSTVIDLVAGNNGVLNNMDPSTDWVAGAPQLESGVIENVFTVTDASGNSSTCTVDVIVLDTISPTVVCQDVTVNIDANEMAEITDADVVSSVFDGCAPLTISISETTFDCDDIGNTIAVTVTATDQNGNFTECTSNVTVADPNSNCCDIVISSVTPTNEVCPGADDGTLTVVATCTSCTGGIEYSIDGFTTFNTDGIFNGLADGSYDVEVRDAGDATCTDSSSGNVINAGVDMEDPTATCQDITVNLDGSGNASITAMDIDNGSSDNCSAITLGVSQTSFDCSMTGANTVTLTVTDGSGNTATCESQVTIVNTSAPTLTCGADVEAFATPATCTATLADLGITDPVFSGGCALDNLVNDAPMNLPLGSTQITWTATDLSGATATCTQIVVLYKPQEIPNNNIDDDCDGDTDETPLVTLVPLDGTTTNGTCVSNTDCCSDTYCYGLEYTPDYTGTLDNYTTGFIADCVFGNPVVYNESCVMTDNSLEIEDCAGAGGVLFNSSGFNGTLPVTSGTPVILHQICFEVPANESITIVEDAFTGLSMSINLSPDFTVTENPVLISDIEVYGNVAPNAVAGTISSCYVDNATAMADAIAATTATDDCTATMDIIFTSEVVGSCDAIVRVFSTDACGLVDTIEYNTTIDGVGPVINGLADNTVVDGCLAVDAPSAFTTVAELEALTGVVSIDDACSMDSEMTVTHTQTVSGSCPILVERVYTITDVCGNAATLAHTVEVEDTTNPEISGTISDSFIEGCSIADLPVAETTVAGLESLNGEISISDGCDDVNLIVTSDDTVIPGCEMQVIRVYSIVDQCGNETQAIHKIYISDDTAPALTAGTLDACYPADADAMAAAIAATTVTDACTASPVVSAFVTGSCPSIVSVVGEDMCGNKDTLDYSIQITNGNVPVEIGGPAMTDMTITDAADTLAVTPPQFEDACGNVLSGTGPAYGGTYVAGDCEGTVTYTWTYTDCAGVSSDWTFTYFIECQDVNIRVFLEGAYDVAGDSLETVLNTNHQLPGQDHENSPIMTIRNFGEDVAFGHPYNTAPWNYSGTLGMLYGDVSRSDAPAGTEAYPSSVVDWVLVTVRENGILPANDVWTCAGIVHSDGSVNYPEQCPDMLNIDVNNDYYIVVQHRNHLPILDTATVMNNGSFLDLDFTTQDSYRPNSFRKGQVELGTSIYGMILSNGDQAGFFGNRTSVNSGDKTVWREEQNDIKYANGDFNMDGKVDSADETLWKNKQNSSVGINF